MPYSINFQALALWIAVAAVAGGGYYILSSSATSQQTSFNIGMEQDTAPGDLTRLSIEKDGEPIQAANISINGEFIGTTNSQGIKGFETPDNNFTVEASKGDISSKTTFAVEDGSFSSPDDLDSDDDSNNSDGSDSDGEEGDSSDGSEDSDDSSNEDSNQEGSEDNQQDTSEDSSETVDDFTGLEIDEDPRIRELRTITIYDEGEQVTGAEVTVNGEIVGTTNAGGKVTFGVPNVAEVSISTDTGLSETFTVQDYTEDDQNQTDDQNDTEDSPHDIQLDSDPVSGTTNRIILYDQGDRVSGETIYLDGSELGQTGSNGAIEFEVPLQEQITVSTDYDLESQTFNVTENHPEPDTTFLSPDSGEEFETPKGDETDIEFEAAIETTENSGKAKLIIDGSEAYTQELSQGENTVSTTQGLSSGTHDWRVEVDTDEFDTASDDQSITVNEVEPQEGLELSEDPEAGEHVTVTLYQDNEPVEREELFVNDEGIGTTDEFGEIGFEVPNEEEITITTESGLDKITRDVEEYMSDSSYSFDTSQPLIRGLNYDLKVNRDGSSLSNADVFVDGVDEGSTDENGKVSFEVPLRESVELRVNDDQGEYSESVDTSYVDFEIIRPQNEGLSQDYGNDSSSIDVNTDFEIDTDLSGTYRVYLDDTEKSSGSLESGSHAISDTISTDQEGNSSLYIEYETDEGKTVQSYTSDFEVEWLENPFTFDMISPINQEQLDDYEVELNFESTTNLERDYDVGVRLDGDLISSDENLNGDYGDRTVFTTVDEGMHEWYVEVNDSGKDETLKSETQEFETTVQRPVANATNQDPDDGETLENDEVSVDIRSYEDLEYSLIIDGSAYETKTLDSGEEGIYTFDVSGLESGEHTWYVDIESRETSKTFETEEWGFNAD